MKRRIFVLAVITLVAISSLADFALSLSEDPKWTPYVLDWKQKRTFSKTRKPVEITVCKTSKEESGAAAQR